MNEAHTTPSPQPHARTRRDRHDARDGDAAAVRPLGEQAAVERERLDQQRHRLDRVDSAARADGGRGDARERADVGAEVEDDVAWGSVMVIGSRCEGSKCSMRRARAARGLGTPGARAANKTIALLLPPPLGAPSSSVIAPFPK